MAESTKPDEPLDWPEDDSAAPPEATPSGVGLPPPGAGTAVPGGWERNRGEDGADTFTENRIDEDEDNER
jgi:hypothetical protein